MIFRTPDFIRDIRQQNRELDSESSRRWAVLDEDFGDPNFLIVKKQTVGDIEMEPDEQEQKYLIKFSDRYLEDLFEREIRLNKILSQSQWLLPVVDMVRRKKDGAVGLVMKYIDGESLDLEVKKKGLLSSAEMAEVAVQVCFGLHEMHSVGLVHRDIKPGNFFFKDLPGGHRRIYLADFGVSSYEVGEDSEKEFRLWGDNYEKQKRITASLGVFDIDRIFTPEFSSPEQKYENRVDFSSDFFSLGVSLFHLAKSRDIYLFDDPDYRDAVIRGEIGHNSKSFFDNLILVLTALQPDDRSSIIFPNGRQFDLHTAEEVAKAITYAIHMDEGLGERKQYNEFPYNHVGRLDRPWKSNLISDKQP